MVAAIPTRMARIDPKESKYFREKYCLDLDLVNGRCRNIGFDVASKEREQILKKHRNCLKSLLGAMEATDRLFKASHEGAIRELIEMAEFQVFPRKSVRDLRGRPHLDPEAQIVWELSQAITYEKGPQEGETNWRDVRRVLRFFSRYHPFLASFGWLPENLRSMRNGYVRKYAMGASEGVLLKDVRIKRKRRWMLIERLKKLTNARPK